MSISPFEKIIGTPGDILLFIIICAWKYYFHMCRTRFPNFSHALYQLCVKKNLENKYCMAQIHDKLSFHFITRNKGVRFDWYFDFAFYFAFYMNNCLIIFNIIEHCIFYCATLYAYFLLDTKYFLRTWFLIWFNDLVCFNASVSKSKPATRASLTVGGARAAQGPQGQSFQTL